jgi:hypothetical protein
MSCVVTEYFTLRCSDILLILLYEGNIQCSSLNVTKPWLEISQIMQGLVFVSNLSQ